MHSKSPHPGSGVWNRLSGGLSRPLRSCIAALFVAGPQRLLLAIGLMVCVGLLEGVGLMMLVPFLQLVGLGAQQGSLNEVARWLAAAFEIVGVRPGLLSILAVYVAVVALQGLLVRWQAAAAAGLEHDLVASLRERLYRAISDTSWLFFARSRLSDFTHVLTAEVARAGTTVYYLLSMFAGGVVAGVYIAFALKLSAATTALVCACGGVLMLALRGRTQASRAAGEELSVVTKQLQAAATEHLGGMKTAKSYGAEARHVMLFSILAGRARDADMRAVRGWADTQYWFALGSVLILSVVLYVSLEVLSTEPAGVLLLVFLFHRLMPRLARIQQGYQGLVHSLPAFVSVGEMLVRCEGAAEPKAERQEEVGFAREIRLEDVSFEYGGARAAAVVQDLDLVIRAGETTAIVGPSGAGKTTVADLVMGLLAPVRGRVLVDGVPLGPERVRSWRERIGYVAQETFLFHDTVRANLLWARPESTEGELWQALRMAGAEEFVTALPQGLGTVLGDRGVLISGGERQRLPLARALLREPSLLILDEATSSLDSENEEQIKEAIDRLHTRVTILLITHRLSTVRGADVIHVLERGRLVESGRWEDLVARKGGRFRELCKAQGLLESAWIPATA